jgi:conjugal transfer pilus assembly protein TrbC
MPTDAELERVPVPSTPNIDAAGKPTPLDVEAIARRYQSLQAAVAPDANAASPRLQIFVTLAMPEASLAALIAQAARAHAVLVLRGAKNGSIRQTLDAATKLIGTQRVAWQIDPPAFARYRITAAPLSSDPGDRATQRMRRRCLSRRSRLCQSDRRREPRLRARSNRPRRAGPRRRC